MLCGDFNSRIGNEKDYAIFDTNANIDILPIDYETDEAMPRSSQGKINANGRKLLDFCKLNTLRIANGRQGSDEGVGKYTYDVSTGRSAIDYVIASPYLLNTISTFHVGEPNILSDWLIFPWHVVIVSMNRSMEVKMYLSKGKKEICIEWDESWRVS